MKETPVLRYLHFKTQPGALVKNATFGLSAGNRTRDSANLVRCSGAVAKTMATSLVFMRADCRLRVYSETV